MFILKIVVMCMQMSAQSNQSVCLLFHEELIPQLTLRQRVLEES